MFLEALGKIVQLLATVFIVPVLLASPTPKKKNPVADWQFQLSGTV